MWFPYMLARAEAFFPTARVKEIPQDCRAGIYDEKREAYGSVLSESGFLGGKIAFLWKLLYLNTNTVLVKYIDNDTLAITPIGAKSLELENPCALLENVRFDTESSSYTLDALACMPSLIWLVVKIDTLGRKFFLSNLLAYR